MKHFDYSLQEVLTRYVWCDESPKEHYLKKLLNECPNNDKSQLLNWEWTKDSVTYTPLQHAANKGHGKILAILISAFDGSKARLQILKSKLPTPLHIAAEKGHTGAVKEILECLRPEEQQNLISARDFNEKTALHAASSSGSLETVRSIISAINHAQLFEIISAQDKRRRTAIHTASEAGHTDTVAAILDHLTCELISIKDDENQTASQLARTFGHKRIYDMLYKCEHATEQHSGDLDEELEDKIIELTGETEELRAANKRNEAQHKESLATIDAQQSEIDSFKIERQTLEAYAKKQEEEIERLTALLEQQQVTESIERGFQTAEQNRASGAEGISDPVVECSIGVISPIDLAKADSIAKGFENKTDDEAENGTSDKMCASEPGKVNQDQMDERFFQDHLRMIRILSHVDDDDDYEDVSPPCITCTVISYTLIETGNTKHVALLSFGHPCSVLSYENRTEKYVWSVTTVHTKKHREFVKIFGDMCNPNLKTLRQCKELDSPIHVLISDLDTGSWNVTQPKQVSPELDDGKIVYIQNPLVVEISPEPWIVTFTMRDGTAEDSVSGYFPLMQGYDCVQYHNSDESVSSGTDRSSSDGDDCEDLVSLIAPSLQVFNQAGSSSLSTSIDQLNRAGDRNIVTVKTVWRTVSDTTHMLLHWMAGFQTRVTENSQPEEETGTSTHYINSDEVFSDIVSGYTQKFLTNPELDDKQRNKLQISCPAFLVTESEGSSPPDPKTNILHPAVSCDQEGRHTYEFKHGKIEDLLVQIREPASPADTGYATGGGDVVKEKMKLEPQLIRQKKMEDEHMEIFHLLRKLDESKGQMNSKSILTAIVSTVIDNRSPTGVSTAVFITKGIFYDDCNKLSKLEISETFPGWMTTTRWITSSVLSKSLSDHWDAAANKLANQREKSLFKGQTKFACLNVDELKARQLELANMEFNTGRSTIRVVNDMCSLTLDAELGYSGDPRKYVSAPIAEVTKDNLDYSCNPSNVIKMITRLSDAAAENAQSPVAIYACTTETRVLQRGKKSKIKIRGEINQSEFCVAIDGRNPDVILPDCMDFRDPLTNICVQKKVVHSKMLMDQISEKWNLPKDSRKEPNIDGSDPTMVEAGHKESGREPNETCQSSEMAKFGVIASSKNGPKWQVLAVKGNTVRLDGLAFSDDVKRMKVEKAETALQMELWCHSSRINGLHAVLSGDLSVTEKLDEITRETDSERRQHLLDEFAKEHIDIENMPKSVNHATMGIQYPLLPKPNQLGIAPKTSEGESVYQGCLSHDRDDSAHLQMSQAANQGKGKTLDTVKRELVSFHEDKKKKVKK